MASFKFTKDQQQRLREIYEDANIPTKEIANVIEKEMGYVLPYEAIKHLYNTLLGLPLRKRKRKEEISIVLEEEENIPLENTVTANNIESNDNW